MATKTFSSRAEEKKIAFADTLAQREYDMSFAKYCGTILLDSVCETERFPDLDSKRRKDKIEALNTLKAFAETPHDPKIALLSDDEVKELIRGRYA